ncbi:MAG: hypothetical protein AB1414_16295, partial [bacterium]
MKKNIFLFVFMVCFTSISFAINKPDRPKYNGSQPFIRPMAGGQVHITWERPDTTNFYYDTSNGINIFYELQFKKSTDSTWYQYFPGGPDKVTDSTSINDPTTYKIKAQRDEKLEHDIESYDLSPTPNYYGFGVSSYTDTTVTPDLNKHYLIHIQTSNPAGGEDLFYYSTNVVSSREGHPNTYFYRIRSRVENSYGSVEVSPWFPSYSGDSVTVNIFPESGKEIYFYNDLEIDTASTTEHSKSFVFKKGRYWAIPCYYLAQNTNSYVFSIDSSDTDINIISNAFETGGEKYNKDGIFKQDQDVFGAVVKNSDNDNHISIVRIPINPYGYFPSNSGSSPARGSRVSNFREMIFIDNVIPEIIDLKGTLAHEFQHLIHDGYDMDEKLWVNEGCSGLAEDINGYLGVTGSKIKDFETTYFGNEQLFEWDTAVTDRYGITALWTMFLQERFGRENIKKYVADTTHGTDVFHAGGPFGNVTFDSAFQEWTLMNYLNDSTFYNLDTSFADYNYLFANDTYVRNEFSIKPIAETTIRYCSTGDDVPYSSTKTMEPSCGNYLSWENYNTTGEMFKIWVEGDLLRPGYEPVTKDYYYVLEKYDSAGIKEKAEKNKILNQGSDKLILNVPNFGLYWNKVTLILTNKNETTATYKYAGFFARGGLYETVSPVIKVYDTSNSIIPEGGYTNSRYINIEVEDAPQDVGGIASIEISTNEYDRNTIIFKDYEKYGTSHLYGSTEIASQVAEKLPESDGKLPESNIFINVIDAAFNAGTYKFTVDLTPPDIMVKEPSDGDYVNTTRPEIKCNIIDVGLDTSTLKIIFDTSEYPVKHKPLDEKTWQISYTPDFDLGEGEHQWIMYAKDRVGYELDTKANKFSFKVDTKPPEVIDIFPPDGFVTDMNYQ